MKSRKFIAFIVYTVIFTGLYLVATFTNQLNVSSDELIKAMLILISIYTGGNVTSKVIRSIWYKDGLK